MKKNRLFYILMGILLICGCENEEPFKNCIDPERIRSGACTLDYKPVCGCDGKTYGNACTADLAGVTSWEEGSCN